jgi:soluble P-type ATPase
MTMKKRAPTEKPGIEIKIPGFGDRHIKTILSDFTGTLSCGGKLIPGVKEGLISLAGLVDIHIITADTNNTAKSELEGLPIELHRLSSETGHDCQKRDQMQELDLVPSAVAVFGNGNNDRLLLKAVKDAGGLAIAVENGEGCALDAILSAHFFIAGALNALDLLLKPNRCKATLRF